MKYDYRRSHDCGALTLDDLEKRVTLSGWVHRRRDLGKLIFIDLRDRFGITQLVFDPTKHLDLHTLASNLRSEWVISVRGLVCKRKTPNARLPTGEIEIEVEELEILSSAKTPPFSISEPEMDVNEELRLQFRYLDIRRGIVANNLVLRSNVMHQIRSFLQSHNFLEITTPILVKSVPETGARDYLVASRIYPGNFYGLPQSPQIFKQLLMVAGMDRYFQIAPCFRDEDLRSDRQPEFMQVDIEMSFAIPEDLHRKLEELMALLFKVKTPFSYMTHADCLEYYGTDRPDLRFGMPLVRIDEIAAKSTSKIFLDPLAIGGCVKALCVKKGASASRKEIDGYTEFVKQFGLGGLAWIKRQEEGLSSSVAKFFTEEQMQAIFSRTELEQGDLLLIAAGAEERVNQGLDHLRRHLAKERKLIPEGKFHFLWVVDFPLFRWNGEESRIESEHHPFTSPHPDDLHLLDTDPLKVRALAYDLVLNGYELGGGSQRIHNGDLQEKIFNILQLSPQDIEQKFGFFVEALKYGTPPHLGLALGLDRVVMLLCGTDNIRDVIGFPKTTKASDLMMQTPSPASQRQLADLQLKTTAVEIPW
jgi:aspartyl-tRNA synthetase